VSQAEILLLRKTIFFFKTGEEERRGIYKVTSGN